MNEEIYVVAETDLVLRDNGKQSGSKGPLVFETYTEDATKENAEKLITRLNNAFGKCRIAKLKFIDY